MKKSLFIFVLAAIFMLFALMGCTDAPTAPDMSEPDSAQQENTVKYVSSERIYNHDDFTYQLALTAFDAEDNALWTYTSEEAYIGQAENLEYLAVQNGLVYVNESGYVSEPEREKHVLKALDLQTGELVWENTDYMGAGSSFVFGADGTLYIGGYFGPDCVAIDASGKTIWTYTDDFYYWLYDISLNGKELILVFEANNALVAGEPEEGPFEVRLSVNGEKIG